MKKFILKTLQITISIIPPLIYLYLAFRDGTKVNFLKIVLTFFFTTVLLIYTYHLVEDILGLFKKGKG